MENSLKGLMLAAGIIITCIIISLGFYIAREASDTASSGTGQINELQAEFADTSKTMYENTEVSGSEVINVIRKFSDEMIGVKVQTKKNTSYYNIEPLIPSPHYKSELFPSALPRLHMPSCHSIYLPLLLLRQKYPLLLEH